MKQEIEFLKDRLATEEKKSTKKIYKLEKNLQEKNIAIKNLNFEIHNISEIENRNTHNNDNNGSNTSRRNMIKDIVNQDDILTGSM